MASEIRVNTINSRTGFGTITVSETGQDLVGITTIENLTTENTLVGAAASFTGNVQIGGVLTYEDVTNIDSVGLITARSGIEIGARPGVGASITADGNAIFSGITTVGATIKVGGDIETTGTGNIAIPNDSGKFTAGASADLQLFHDGGSSVIRNTNNSASLYLQGSSTGTNNIRCYANGGTHLYWNGESSLYTAEDAVRIPDSTQLELGDASDLKIWHSGSNSFIRNETGNLIIEANGAGDNAIEIIPDGSVWIAYDNSNKIKTTSTGCQITSASANTTKLKIGQTADRGLEITTVSDGSNNDAQVVFNAADTTSSGYHANLVFQLAGVEKARLHGNGDYFQLSSSCTGITFNGDHAAVNQLNDYEEGTWTPTCPGSPTDLSVSGEYRKIGKMVSINGFFSLTSHSNSSTMNISGLPFSGMSGKTFSFIVGNYRYLNLDGGYNQFMINMAGTTMTLREQGDNQNYQNISWDQISNDFQVYFSGVYYTD